MLTCCSFPIGIQSGHSSLSPFVLPAPVIGICHFSSYLFLESLLALPSDKGVGVFETLHVESGKLGRVLVTDKDLGTFFFDEVLQ